jgi:hypothetical protein
VFKKLIIWWKNRRVRRRWARGATAQNHPLELTPGGSKTRMHHGKPHETVELQQPPVEDRITDFKDNSDYAKILNGEKL